MRKILSIVCAAALMLSMVGSMIGTADASGTTKRIIDIVYDNSGSMCGDNSGQKEDRWSQALYAMEVFATMLGSDDEMNVFLMSDSGADPIHVSGNETDRVSKITNAIGGTGNTPFATVTTAGSHISSQSADAERWLIVLTDGAFQGDGAESAESTMKGYTSSGVHVVYLAIGSSAKEFTSDAGAEFYTYKADTSSQILNNITTIANQIFQQQILPAGHISASGTTMTLDIDIPVSQLLVFAQGEDVKISSLTINGTETAPSQQNAVEVTEANIPSGWSTSNTECAEGLRGVIATYTPSGSNPLEKGSYVLDISDTSNVEIYYIAGVTLDCCLVDDSGVKITSDETHYDGSYGVSMQFIDPNTGEPVESDLLNIDSFSGTLTNGSDVQNIDQDTTTVRLTEGEVQLQAVAELPGGVTIDSEYSYTVYPKPLKLNLAAQVPGAYKVSALGTDADPVVITVTKADTGEKLTEEEWNAAALSLSTSSNVLFTDPVKGDEVSTFYVWPDYNGDMASTDTGSIDLTLKVEYQVGNQYAYGSSDGDISITIMDYQSSEMQIKLTPPADTIPLGSVTTSAEEGATSEEAAVTSEELEEAEEELTETLDRSDLGILMNINVKDEYTGEYSPLSSSQYRDLDLTIQGTTADGDEISWSVSKDGDGTYYLLPNEAEAVRFSLKHLDQEVEVLVTVQGVLEDGELVYEGADSTTVKIRTMSLMDIIKEFIKLIITSAIILFLLIGYLGKKKLPMKQLKQATVTNLVAHKDMKVKIQRKWATFLLPYVPQQAVVKCHVPAMNCNFANATVKASGHGNMYLVNSKAYVSPGIKVNGTAWEAAFARGTGNDSAGFTIVSKNQMGRTIGKADF